MSLGSFWKVKSVLNNICFKRWQASLTLPIYTNFITKGASQVYSILKVVLIKLQREMICSRSGNKLISNHRFNYLKKKTIYHGTIFVKSVALLSCRKRQKREVGLVPRRWTKSVLRRDVQVVLKLLNLIYATETKPYKICEIDFLYSKFSLQIWFSWRISFSSNFKVQCFV